MNHQLLKSDCCNANIRTVGSADFTECGDSGVSQIGTCYFECSACGKPCGIINDALIWDRAGTTIQEVKESEPCCGNCMFSDINKDNVRYCRRYPPRSIIDSLSKNGASFYYYPFVSEDWCGEYKRGK